MEPAGPSDIDGKPEMVSERERTNQTPYNPMSSRTYFTGGLP